MLCRLVGIGKLAAVDPKVPGPAERRLLELGHGHGVLVTAERASAMQACILAFLH